MKKYFLSCIILSSFSFCKKNESISVDCKAKTTEYDKVEQLIAGTYVWAYSVYFDDPRYPGVDVGVVRPIDIGAQRRYKFERSGRYTLYENSNILESGTYFLDKKRTSVGNNTEDSTVIYHNMDGVGRLPYYHRVEICSDSAILYPSNGLFRRIYKRIGE